MPLNFQSEPKTSQSGMLTIALFVAAVVIFGIYCVEGATGPLHSLQRSVCAFSSPVVYAGSSVGSGIQGASDAITNSTADEGSLTALRDQNEQLRQKVAEMEEYRLEAQRLAELLNIKSSLGVEGISSAIIGRSGEAYSQTVMISAGSAEGVDVGQTVMGSSGVVGQVISASEHNSIVRLLTDPKSGAAAIIQSSRNEGIVRGSLDGYLYLEDIDSDAVVAEGDVVLTSGQGGSYVSGLMIGTVVRVENLGDIGSQRIVVAQNDQASQLQDVIVVTAHASNQQNAGGGE